MNEAVWNGVASIIANAEVDAGTFKNDGDYYGEDGLLYCGVCHKKRQVKLNFDSFANNMKPVVVKCMCECESKRQEEEEKHRQQEEELCRIDNLRSSSLIESRLRNARLNTYKHTKDNERLYKIALRYVDNFENMYKHSQGILFWGAVGTGKSYTAACIANELLDRKVPVVMTSFVKIFQNLQASQDAEKELMTRFNAAKLLIIDDLGTERNTDYGLEKVYNIIDSRYLSGKPLILTTNLSLQEMRETTDIRYRKVYDRIFEMCYPVQVIGKSWRMNQAADRFDNMKALLEG